jgi:hypothetical protein
MNRIALLAAAGGICCSGLLYADTPADPNAAEAKTIVKGFFQSLKGELEEAMRVGGPDHAVTVCKARAPAIAAQMSADSGWEVGRTSLKLRNPETNTPDAWERAVLEDFEARKAAGEEVTSIAYAETVETADGKTYRFMKAIPTLEVCLTCHGTAIAPSIAEALDESYPDDQARGYELGDIRGAFTLSKPL